MRYRLAWLAKEQCRLTWAKGRLDIGRLVKEQVVEGASEVVMDGGDMIWLWLSYLGLWLW